MYKKYTKIICSCFFLSFFFYLDIAKAKNLELGKTLFLSNCNVCHIGGNNIIIPEKNLKKETLETNGMNNLNAIVYQVINGKNGMPAFGGRLQENEIEEIANYILEESLKNFKN
jgi:cytochrome c6